MQVILCQTFPLGRFHATPWKVFPYDDPHGEWPPSPWRLLRAIIARSYQLERERPPVTTEQREALVNAFSRSTISWRLPEFTWRGPGLRQYQPAEFKRVPATAKVPGMMTYNTTKVQDNFWLTAPDGSNGSASVAIWWFLSGGGWTSESLDLLEACLARMTYFGRAESITEISLVREANGQIPKSNCHLREKRTAGMVPVLAPMPEATLEQAQESTDDPAVVNSTIPPGARWMYAERPRRPAPSQPPSRVAERQPTSLVQFAIGARVAPTLNDTVRLTQRFRGRAIKSFLKLATGKAVTDWQQATPDVRERAALLAGKDGQGRALAGHRHTVFFLHAENGKPVRLCAWRREPFDDLEQAALLAAAEAPLPLGFDDDPWTVTLVPLDSLVLPPPALSSRPSRRWETLTPFVPPRHVFDRRGRVKAGDSVEEQVRQELENRGVDPVGIQISVRRGGWVKVHQTRREQGSQTNTDKLGYWLTLEFPTPQTGPRFLGHSCHFGLGLFVPEAGALHD